MSHVNLGLGVPPNKLYGLNKQVSANIAVKNFLVVENESNNFESEIVTEILTEILTGKPRTENPACTVPPTTSTSC